MNTMLLKRKRFMQLNQIVIIDTFVYRFSSRGAVTGTKVRATPFFYLLLFTRDLVTFRVTRVHLVFLLLYSNWTPFLDSVPPLSLFMMHDSSAHTHPRCVTTRLAKELIECALSREGAGPYEHVVPVTTVTITFYLIIITSIPAYDCKLCIT